MINDINIYIKLLINDGYIIDYGDCEVMRLSKTLDGPLRNSFIELNMQNNGQDEDLPIPYNKSDGFKRPFIIMSVNREYRKRFTELEFIEKNKDNIRNIKLDMLC